MGAKNGSAEHRQLRAVARERYGKQLETAEGCLSAALSEPICDRHHDDAEERLESQWWDRMCLSAIRVIAHDLPPIEDYT